MKKKSALPRPDKPKMPEAADRSPGDYDPDLEAPDDRGTPEFEKMFREGGKALHRHTGHLWDAFDSIDPNAPLFERLHRIKEVLDVEFSRDPLPAEGGGMTPRQNQIAYVELFVDELMGQISGPMLATVHQLGKPPPASSTPTYDEATVVDAFRVGGMIMRLALEDPIPLLHRVLELLQKPKPRPKNRSPLDDKRWNWVYMQMDKLVPIHKQVKASNLVLTELKKRLKDLELTPGTIRRRFNAHCADRKKPSKKDPHA